MNKLIINLEYGRFPIWIYSKNGELMINDLPWELSAEKEIDDSFAEIQNIYNSLFINNSSEFKYIGFKSDIDKLRFIKMIDSAINLIKMKTGDLYSIEKKFDIQNL